MGYVYGMHRSPGRVLSGGTALRGIVFKVIGVESGQVYTTLFQENLNQDGVQRD